MPRKPLDALEGANAQGSCRGWGFPIPDGCLTASAGSGAAPRDLFVRSLRHTHTSIGPRTMPPAHPPQPSPYVNIPTSNPLTALTQGHRRPLSSRGDRSPRSRQSFGTHLEGNPGLPRDAPWALRVCPHPQTRLVAQPHRVRLLEDGSHLLAAYPGHFSGRTQGTHPPRSRRDERGPSRLSFEEVRSRHSLI
jgi:hypothetical protein